jgi:hypothetical protein
VGVGERLGLLQAFRDDQHLFSNLSTDPDFATRRISQAQPEQCPDKRPLICAAHLLEQAVLSELVSEAKIPC